MTVLRIYADFNGLTRGPRNATRTAVILDTYGSLRDLCNAGVVLREGLPLVAVDASDDDEDLEGHGEAVWDAGRHWWVVEFDAQGVRYVPAGDRSWSDEFHCVGCRMDLAEQIKIHGLYLDDRCPACGTLVHAPLAPPVASPR